jgi:hypothetical protein
MEIKGRFVLLAPIIYFLFSTNLSQGQNSNIRYDSLYSQVLKEQRSVEIILPKKYGSNATDKFDVLYALDGEWNTSLLGKVYDFLEYAKFIPTNMIIVSIPNHYKNGINMRDRDFTPTSTIQHTEYGDEYSHDGFNLNFSSAFMFNKKQKFGYVFFTNCNKGSELNKRLLVFFNNSDK